MEYDLKKYANPNCEVCNGNGRYVDSSEDEWGMVLYVRCDCTKGNDPNYNPNKVKKEE